MSFTQDNLQQQQQSEQDVHRSLLKQKLIINDVASKPVESGFLLGVI